MINKKFIFVTGPSESGKSGGINYIEDNYSDSIKHLKIQLNLNGQIFILLVRNILYLIHSMILHTVHHVHANALHVDDVVYDAIKIMMQSLMLKKLLLIEVFFLEI